VILALDVSGSMQGDRISMAVNGCQRFIDEAVETGYRVGLILWHHDVAADVAPEVDPKAARDLLKTSGGVLRRN
jgi:Mg-chelatase subunit ChlD